MAVTDLTDSLPWWARQSGAGAMPGPGATGGPAAAPQGAGGAAGGGNAAWLQYLQQMFGPGAAQAAGNDPMAALRQGGSPAPSALSGGGPSVPQSVASLQPTPQQPPASPAMSNMPAPQSPGPAASNMPFPGQVDPRGYFAPSANPNAPAPNAQNMQGAANPLASAGAAPPVPGPLSTGGASAMGSTSNPRFMGISAPNASPQNSMRGGPQGTALNLAGMFGGGQGAARPASAVRGPMAQPDLAQRVPLANAPMPPVMPEDVNKRRKMLPNY